MHVRKRSGEKKKEYKRNRKFFLLTRVTRTILTRPREIKAVLISARERSNGTVQPTERR